MKQTTIRVLPNLKHTGKISSYATKINLKLKKIIVGYPCTTTHIMSEKNLRPQKKNNERRRKKHLSIFFF